MSYFNLYSKNRAFPQLQSATDQRLPILVSPSIHICSPECVTYNMSLPDLFDFTTLPHSSSTRIAKFYLCDTDYWLFRNFRGEVYYGSNYSPPCWYYQHPEWGNMKLCPFATSVLEEVYRRFLPPFDQAYAWLFRGYVKYSHTEGSGVVLFDKRIYLIQTSSPKNSQCSGTRSPPGFPVRNNDASIQPMDWQSAQQRNQGHQSSQSHLYNNTRETYSHQFDGQGSGTTSYMQATPECKLNSNDVFDTDMSRILEQLKLELATRKTQTNHDTPKSMEIDSTSESHPYEQTEQMKAKAGFADTQNATGNLCQVSSLLPRNPNGFDLHANNLFELKDTGTTECPPRNEMDHAAEVNSENSVANSIEGLLSEACVITDKVQSDVKSLKNENEARSYKTQVDGYGSSVIPGPVLNCDQIQKPSNVSEEHNQASTVSRMDVLALNPETTTSQSTSGSYKEASDDTQKCKRPENNVKYETKSSSSSNKPAPSSRHVCPPECFCCNMHHPNLYDFTVKPSPLSTRIAKFHLSCLNYWTFRNFRHEVYFASNNSPREWYYHHPERGNIKLCLSATSILEDVYGRFLLPLTDQTCAWLFHGYVKDSHTGDGGLVQFDEETYYKLNENTNSQFYGKVKFRGMHHSSSVGSVRNNNTTSQTHNQSDKGSERYESSVCKVRDKNAEGTTHLSSPQNEKEAVNESGVSVKSCAVLKVDQIRNPSAASEEKVDQESTVSRMDFLPLNPKSSSVTPNCVSDDIRDGTRKCKTRENNAKLENNSQSSSDQLKGDAREKNESVSLGSPGGSSPVGYVKGAQNNKQNMRGKSNAEAAFSMLQEELQKKFQALKQFLPEAARAARDNPPVSPSSVYDVIVKYRDHKTKQIVTGPKLIGSLNGSRRTILLQSLPGFGKTTVCYMLAELWSSLLKNERKFFKLCFLADLSNFNLQTSLEDALISACVKCINNARFGPNVVKDVLTGNAEKILLLLDGYDTLNISDQKKVYTFLKSSVVFSKSYILVTTRPTDDKEFLEFFSSHAAILGFSKEYLQKLVPQNQVQQFLGVFSDQKLTYLSDLSPYFASIVANVLKENLYNFQKGGSLYELLDCMFQLDFSSKITPDLSSDLIPKLGELFFVSLVQGKYVFSEDVLQKVFQNHYEFFIKCNIFYRQRKGKQLVVSSKILMVFFATLYLRNKWVSLYNTSKRIEFLNDVLCQDCCSGDYVTGENGSLYFVGLIPEIVLKYGSSPELMEATIEMYYDVDRIEYSQAFDSVNLLARVAEKSLDRFGFKRRPNDDSNFLATFGDIFNLLCFDNCTVGYRFYDNAYENKKFVVIEVEGYVPNTLLAILKSNDDGSIQRAYVDFACSEIKEVFEFVSSLLAKYREDYELPGGLKDGSFSDYLQALVSQIYFSQSPWTATVMCGSDSHPPDRNQSATFNIFSRNEPQERFLSVSFEDSGSVSSQTYTKGDLHIALENIRPIVENLQSNLPDLRLTIILS